jgi:hypothetical protein
MDIISQRLFILKYNLSICLEVTKETIENLRVTSVWLWILNSGSPKHKAGENGRSLLTCQSLPRCRQMLLVN